MIDEDKFIFDIGSKIKEIKEAKNLSYSELESRANIDKSIISKICNGDQNITLRTFIKMANALEVSPIDILS